MFARVSTYQGSPDRLDGDIQDTRDTIIPQMNEVPGFLGLYVLVNRENGRALSITLWEDEAAMRASEEAANRVRNASAERHGEEIVSVERFEVGITPSVEVTGLSTAR